MKKIAIVIITYERLLATQRCIESVFAHTHIPFELIIFDNHSKPEVRAYLETVAACKTFLDENLGLYKALNMAIGSTDAQLISFLDCDIVVSEGWLEHLTEELLTNEQYGLAGARFVYPDGTLQEGYPLLTADGWYGPNQTERAAPTNCQYIAIGCSVFRRDAWEKVGGFDESYFISHGDIDFCFKLRYLGGYHIRYQPAVSVIHDHFYGKEEDYEAIRFKETTLNNDFGIFKSKWEEAYINELEKELF